VEAFLAYLRGRDMTAAHEAGVRVPDPNKSFDPYLEAARRDPHFADAQDRMLALALDFALGGQGPVEAAREGCQRLLDIDPAAFKAHLALAEIDLSQGDPVAAESRLLKALALRPDCGSAFERMGTALVRQRRFEEAVGWFERALRERQDDTDAMQGLGVALAECGRLEEAVAAWRATVQMGVSSAHLHDNLARALRAPGAGAQDRGQAALRAGSAPRSMGMAEGWTRSPRLKKRCSRRLRARARWGRCGRRCSTSFSSCSPSPPRSSPAAR
jgi:Tfp pilus assembly protein PilF